MCGIAGIKRMRRPGQEDSAPITIWTIEQLLLECQKRGIHSTGVAVQYANGDVSVVKAPEIAWKFVKSGVWKEFLTKHAADQYTLKDEIRTVLCHARQATQGDPWKNENNHPVYDGITAITHNGSVRNDDMLFRDLKYKRIAAVDSDAIRAILDAKGLTKAGVWELNRMSGPAAIAAVSQRYPGKLLLARSGSPLVLGAFENANWLIWCSKKEGIHTIAREWRDIWGLDYQRSRADLTFNPVEIETAMLIGEDGLEWREGFTSNHGAAHNLVYRCHDQNFDKQKTWNERKSKEQAEVYKEVLKDQPEPPKMLPGTQVIEQKLMLPDLIPCTNPACNVVCQLTAKERAMPIWALMCPQCKTSLGDKGDA